MTHISELTPDPKNARVHTPRNIGMIAESLQKYGPARSISIDEDNKILAGNGVVEASMQVGIEYVRVYDRETGQLEPEPPDGAPYIFATRLSNLNPEQKTLFSIADNRTGDLSTFSPEVLQSFMDDGLDLEQFWFPDELADLLAGDDEPLAGLTDPDAVPDVPDDPITKPGDVWLLGEHRVMCGDSTVVTDVDRPLAGAKPQLMVTDPPYGVNLDQSWRDKALGAKAMGPGNRNTVSSDDRADWNETWALFPGDISYIWHASKYTDVVMASLRLVGFEIVQQLIWNKSIMVMGRSDYHFKHEPCWYAVRKGKTHGWIGDRQQTTVIEAKSPNHIMSGSDEVKTEHPTQKPVECMSYVIHNHEGNVYDPFLGSGTTLIAAEQLGRTCYGMEISPAYTDVCVQRYEQFTGQTATRETHAKAAN